MNVKSYTQPVTQDVRRIQIDMTHDELIMLRHVLQGVLNDLDVDLRGAPSPERRVIQMFLNETGSY